MRIIVDAYACKIEVEEAPRDITLKELRKIIDEAVSSIGKSIQHYWNPDKGVFEAPSAGRLEGTGEIGFVKLGLFKKYFYHIMLDLKDYKGRIRIEKCRRRYI